ncbi:MAG: molecular chaperone HscC [Francisellaceae bacterium]|jgi:molecular chaperone HscC|nr:molecular chaperone HscC [Francisellaceae bacterium]MBT6208388.1 molecular chaperone HscC [Francisellaceae bacterium]MBT6539017.1 molecular chaperone HscC [Francisellaceae bacterium]
MTIIGIDLGTTNSLVAVFKNNRAELIPNALGDYLTPSVVSFDGHKSVLVGQPAKSRAITHPHLTVRNVKRNIGTNLEYKLGKQKFTAEEITSFILKSLKEDAQRHLGENIEEAVISVPAYFNALQRRATINAAKIAGLKVELLVNEPTAAALAYGINLGDTSNTFMIFDLGGGTFDITIVEYFDGLLEVRASCGDNYLGGENFSEALLEYFCSKSGLKLDEISLTEKGRLVQAIEKLKIKLTSDIIVNITIKLHDQEYCATILRDDFLSHINSLVHRFKQPILRAISDSDINIKELQDVVLVGGATRMPLVRDFIVKTLGKFPCYTHNPDEVVAIGAAIQAGLKQNTKALDDIVLADVCPYTLGTRVVKLDIKNEFDGYKYLPIIERNTKIPVSRFETLEPTDKKQKEINIEVLQGENRNPDKNISLGTLNVKVPKNVNEWPPYIDVRYTYDINGLLEVEAMVQETGEITSTVFQNFNSILSEEEVAKSIKKLSSIKIPPIEVIKNKSLLTKSEALYEELLGEQREVLEYYISEFEKSLNLQDDTQIASAYADLKMAIDELEPQL